MIYVILVIIFILFIIINKYLIIQENYHTYFIPFYNVESNLLRDFYINKDYNKNFFKHKMNYDYIYIYSNKTFYDFFKNFNKNLINKSKIVNTKLIKLDNYKENIKNILKNNNSITNITLPIYLKNKSDDINLICNLNKIYLLCITKLKYNFFNLNDIPNNSKIGILDEKNTIYFYYDKIFKDINKEYNNINIIIYKTQQELFDALMNEKVKIILYFSELPNKDLNNFIDYDFMNELIILPFDLNDKIKNLFIKKNDFCKIEYFDLNRITQKYLPKKFGDYYYFQFRPNIKLLSLKELLICNNKIDASIINDIFSFILNNKHIYNNTPYQIDYIEPSYDLIKYIPYNSEILKLFRKYGYITNEDSDKCKYFVGVKECNKDMLKNYGF